MGLPLRKNVNFSTFWTSRFYSLERRFFALEYHKRHFPILTIKKKHEKVVFFYQMHGLIRWEKCQLFLLFDLVVFKALKGVFFLEYRKRHFFLPILPLKKVREMAIFKRNSRVNQFQKMSIFCFLSSCIYSLQKCFFF